MANPISTHLKSLEGKIATTHNKHGRVIRIVANKEDEDAAMALLLTEGYDPDGDDIGIIRLIALSMSHVTLTSSR